MAVRSLIDLLVKQQALEITKYLAVGGVNFILTFIIYFLGLRVFGWHYLLALIFAWLSGVLFTYTANFRWVFRPEKTFRFNIRFRKYIIISSACLIVNLAALKVLVVWGEVDPFWAQAVLIVPVVVFNFFATKLWSMSKNRQDFE